MKFSIIINKWTNFYFFVQNLSEWHFSNRKDYNVLWRKELEKFSSEEEKSLKKFKEIRLKYKSSRTFFEYAFFTSKNPLKKLKDDLSSKEYQSIKNTFSILETKFNILYKKDLPFLKQWQKKLDNEINNSALVKSIINTLNILFNTSVSETKIKVFLLLSSSNHTGGGANIDDKSVNIEVSRYPLKGANHAMGIIWHETTHLLFQNYYFYPLVLQYFHGDQKTADFINEIVISSLFPKGILGIRLLKNKPAVTLSSKINSQQTIEILNLTKKYIDQKIILDKNYITQLQSIIKK